MQLAESFTIGAATRRLGPDSSIHIQQPESTSCVMTNSHHGTHRFSGGEQQLRGTHKVGAGRSESYICSINSSLQSAESSASTFPEPSGSRAQCIQETGRHEPNIPLSESVCGPNYTVTVQVQHHDDGSPTRPPELGVPPRVLATPIVEGIAWVRRHERRGRLAIHSNCDDSTLTMEAATSRGEVVWPSSLPA